MCTSRLSTSILHMHACVSLHYICCALLSSCELQLVPTARGVHSTSVPLVLIIKYVPPIRFRSGRVSKPCLHVLLLSVSDACLTCGYVLLLYNLQCLVACCLSFTLDWIPIVSSARFLHAHTPMANQNMNRVNSQPSDSTMCQTILMIIGLSSTWCASQKFHQTTQSTLPMLCPGCTSPLLKRPVESSKVRKGWLQRVMSESLNLNLCSMSPHHYLGVSQKLSVYHQSNPHSPPAPAHHCPFPTISSRRPRAVRGYL